MIFRSLPLLRRLTQLQTSLRQGIFENTHHSSVFGEHGEEPNVRDIFKNM